MVTAGRDEEGVDELGDGVLNMTLFACTALAMNKNKVSLHATVWRRPEVRPVGVYDEAIRRWLNGPDQLDCARRHTKDQQASRPRPCRARGDHRKKSNDYEAPRSLVWYSVITFKTYHYRGLQVQILPNDGYKLSI